MKYHYYGNRLQTVPFALKLLGNLTVACSLLATVPAMAETTFSGQSDTILRMGQTIDKNNLYPAYEYLRFSLVSAEKDGSSISFNFGGWGRVDLGDKSSPDRYTDKDLQYGYLSYRGAKNNFTANAGRQFVVEGVAAQRLDGLYLRNDFAAGFAGAAYVGAPVVTEPNIKADDIVFGGRITHSVNKYYTVGISAIKSKDNGNDYREEEGIDLWLHPVKEIDITGRSSYNSVTDGWMEHDYTVSYNPLDSLSISANVSNINYKDYFYKVTTNALLLNNGINRGTIDPNEVVLSVGGVVAYKPLANLSISGDYKSYNYDIAKTADYYGGKVSYALADSFAAGLSIHRMDGKTARLKYDEYRLYASKKIGHLDLAADYITIIYDKNSNHLVNNAVTIVGSAGYEFSESLKLGADVDYSHNQDFRNEVRGLIKLTYLFDKKFAAEGRTDK